MKILYFCKITRYRCIFNL